MREEMYIPGQDDFPNWDEFYSSRAPQLSRMRYSFKTLLLLPLLVAFVCFMYLVGYQKGTWDQERLTTDLAAERKARELAERTARNDAELAATERQVRERAVQETRAAVRTLNSLAIEIQTKMAATPALNEAGHRLLATLSHGLNQVAAALQPAAGPDVAAKPAAVESHALVWSHLDLGEAFLSISVSQESAAADAGHEFREAVEMAHSLAQLHSESIEARRDLFAAQTKLGDFDRQLGRAAAASDAYRDALETAQLLAYAIPKNPLPPRVVSVACSNLGDMQLHSGRALAAGDNYQEALDIIRKLATSDPRNAELQRDLAVMYGKLGDARLQSTDAAAMREGEQAGFELRPGLVQDDPLVPRARRDDYFRFAIAGDGNRQFDDLTTAREAYQTSLVLLRKLPRGNPPTARGQTDLAHGFSRLGDLETAAENYPAAAKWLEQAISILEASGTNRASADQAPGDDSSRANWLKDEREKLVFCRAALDAIDDLDFLLRQPKKEIPQWLAIRGRALARAGRHSDATAAADKLASLEPRRGEALVAAAEIYALCAGGSQSAGSGTKASTSSREPQDRSAAQAVTLLKSAMEMGSLNDANSSAILLSNHNLASLISREDFTNLLANLDAAAAEKKRQAKKP